MKEELHPTVCDKKVYSGIYNRYAQELHNYLYYRFGESLNPKDKVQEAFIRLWENCSKVSASKARSYLYTVANNLTLNTIKHQKVILKYQQHTSSGHSNESPEFLLEKKQYLKQYQEALSKLPEEQRVAFLLNKADGKKHKEIAQILGVTRKVVEYRIYTAFQYLKSELEGFNIK